MTTMLDKMARAMYPQAFQDTTGEPPVIVRRVADYREQAFTKARAALQAIREVDEDTFRAGEMAMPGYNDCGPGEPWLAMIDHILSEGRK
jgi:hypothetical protein